MRKNFDANNDKNKQNHNIFSKPKNVNYRQNVTTKSSNKIIKNLSSNISGNQHQRIEQNYSQQNNKNFRQNNFSNQRHHVNSNNNFQNQQNKVCFEPHLNFPHSTKEFFYPRSSNFYLPNNLTTNYNPNYVDKQFINQAFTCPPPPLNGIHSQQSLLQYPTHFDPNTNQNRNGKRVFYRKNN